MTAPGDDQSLRATGRLARTWRALGAARRQRASARAEQSGPGERERTAEDERVNVSQRLDAARARLKASIAPPEDVQRGSDVGDQRGPDAPDQHGTDALPPATS